MFEKQKSGTHCMDILLVYIYEEECFREHKARHLSLTYHKLKIKFKNKYNSKEIKVHL